MKKIKVLFVTHHWSKNSHHSEFGGYERLVKYIPKNLIIPTVLTWGEKEETFEDEGIEIIIKKIPKFMRFIRKRKILSEYASKISYKYDLIHALYEDVTPLDSKVPVIITIHTTRDLDKDSKWLKLKFFSQKKAMKKADEIIVLSKNMKKILSKYTNNKKIKVIPHGIDYNHFKPIKKISKKIEALKENYKKIILCIGTYGTEKEDLIKLSKKMPECLFIVINSFWELEPSKNLIFFKRVSEQELLEIYTISNYLYRPMKFSSANNSILEAMSMGLFIITNKTEGVLDYLNKKHSAISNNFLNKPYKYIPNRINRTEIRQTAKKFNWSRIANKTVKEYLDVLNK